MLVSRSWAQRRLGGTLVGMAIGLSALAPARATGEATEEGASERGSLASRLQVRKVLGEDSLLTCDLRELFRYTPVGGLQPGVLCGWRRGSEPRDTQMLVDAGFNLAGRGEGDGFLGVRWRRRSWSLAEAGVQLHGLTDTSDQWRTDRLQASLNFAFQNRPDADYYRRNGVVAFATAQPSPRVIAGAEYRLDEYASLASVDDLWTLAQEMEIVRRNPAIEAGQMGSLVLRLEWSSRPVEREQVGGVWRHPDASLVTSWPRTHASERLHFRSWTTLELSRRALGSDERLAFTRLMSEQRLHVSSGPFRGLRLRGRVGIAWGAPSQKEERLGGWSTIRGFSFNRYRGDLSLLATAEYRRGPLAVFADAGAVREPAGWSGLLTGVGARLFLWRGLNLGAAWKAIGARRESFPSIRLQLTDSW